MYSLKKHMYKVKYMYGKLGNICKILFAAYLKWATIVLKLGPIS